MTDEQFGKLARAMLGIQEEGIGLFGIGREAYIREFDAKFEITVNDMKISGDIDRSPIPYWKANG